MVENLSLFEMEEQDQEQIRINRSGALDIVKMEFSGAESLSWQELFSGYDSLHAITYSSGISFVYRLLDLFTDAEIIFGCDEVISYSLQEIMAYQYKTIERMRETAGRMKLDLISRIEAETLRFYVARSVLSHEKIYLLSAKDGRKRVIMGSANLSFSAFGGKQRENICYLDGDRAYDWYWDQYCQLREDSTDQIAKEALLCANDGENLEELPIARTIRTKKALIIQPITEVREEVRFSLDIRNLAAKFTPSVPKPDKKGKLMLSPEKIKSIRRQVISNQEKENELQSVYPQLEVSPDEGIARLNGKILDLSPTREEIARDVGLFLKYMDGYSQVRDAAVETMGRLIREMETVLCHSPVIVTQMETLAGMLECHKGKKVYGYLKKPVKAQVDAIVDELAKVPEVAECYEQWNQLRDELEHYYKDSSREHLPLSQQKEFKAIKNMVIGEAERLRLGTVTFEDARMRDEVDEDQDAVYFAWDSDWQMTEAYQSAKEVLEEYENPESEKAEQVRVLEQHAI